VGGRRGKKEGGEEEGLSPHVPGVGEGEGERVPLKFALVAVKSGTLVKFPPFTINLILKKEEEGRKGGYHLVPLPLVRGWSGTT